MKTEAYFIPHCENNECDLGAFEYTCPKCNKTIHDYSVWWKQDEIYEGNPHKFKCENCDSMLIVEWDKEEIDYFVTIVG